MPTPTASPQVASTVGLKNVVIAPLTSDTETEHTYGELQLMAGAIEASITPENADPDVQYADDIEFDTLYPDPELTFSTSTVERCVAYRSRSLATRSMTTACWCARRRTGRPISPWASSRRNRTALTASSGCTRCAPSP